MKDKKTLYAIALFTLLNIGIFYVGKNCIDRAADKVADQVHFSHEAAVSSKKDEFSPLKPKIEFSDKWLSEWERERASVTEQ